MVKSALGSILNRKANKDALAKTSGEQPAADRWRSQ
jgi:hypothetical protein